MKVHYSDISLLILTFIIVPSHLHLFPIEETVQKCDFDESFQILQCVSPVLEIIENLDISNMTRARAIRINEKCTNISRCLSPVKCAQEMKLDKTADLLCDAFHYFSTDFTECQKNITRQMPPCIKQLTNNHEKITSIAKDDVNSCKLINEASLCFKKEISSICGERYWLQIKNYLVKVSKLGNSSCKIAVDNLD